MTKKKLVLALMMTVVLTTLVIGVQAQFGDEPANAQPTSLVGSWMLTITPTGPGAAPPFRALSTFNEDGTMVGTSQGEVCVGMVTTPGHGAWRQTGPRTYAITFMSIAYAPALPVGVFQGTGKTRATITLNDAGDEWTGPSRLDVFEPAGNLVYSGDATVQAKRIVVEPAP